MIIDYAKVSTNDVTRKRQVLDNYINKKYQVSFINSKADAKYTNVILLFAFCLVLTMCHFKAETASRRTLRYSPCNRVAGYDEQYTLSRHALHCSM